MTEEVKRGEIPSYRDAMEGKGTSNKKPEEEKRTPGPVLGAKWQVGSK